ncbi:MAG: Uma2 family endonuclease [Cyanobacteria bacterium J06636_16]
MATTIPVKVPPSLRVTDEQFLAFVATNPELRLERTATGEMIVMLPTGAEGGNYNAELIGDFVVWNRHQPLGKVFDSSSGFRLSNGAIRSPEVAWVAQERWERLTPEERKGFAPLCPDFVIELASETDNLSDLQAKMQEYLDNGCRLGWLINPKLRSVMVYRSNKDVETFAFTSRISGETVLPGFSLTLEDIFKP